MENGKASSNNNHTVTIEELRWLLSDAFPKDMKAFAELKPLVEMVIKVNKELLDTLVYMEQMETFKKNISN